MNQKLGRVNLVDKYKATDSDIENWVSYKRAYT